MFDRKGWRRKVGHIQVLELHRRCDRDVEEREKVSILGGIAQDVPNALIDLGGDLRTRVKKAFAESNDDDIANTIVALGKLIGARADLDVVVGQQGATDT